MDGDGRPYTEHTNARGHTRRETRNALGELVVAEDALGGTVTHRHDAWGLLERVVQRKPADDATAAPASIETTMDHDGLGRRTLLKDPDKGTWTFRHNGFGELVRRESAAGHQVTFRHDALGRVTMRDDRLGGTGKRDGQTVWTYDTARNGLGQLHRVKEQMSGFSRTHEYDGLGRERGVASRLGGETRHERTTYDAHGRVFQRFDASRTAADFSDFGVRHVYNARGHLARVEDARVRNGTSKATHLAVELTDAAGRVVQERLGGDGGLTRVLRHDGQTGRLLGIVTDKLGGGRLQELEMAWDVGGNLKSRMDKGRKGTLTEDFEYDGLDRLEEHQAGAGPVETITYDGYGNIRSRTGVGTYTYSKAHPGRLDKVAGSTYAHDANGNVTSGGGRSIEYASYDLPTSIQRGLARSEFTYGPDRERLVRRDLSGGELLRETWHLAGVERTKAADGSVELKRFLPGGAMETVAYDAEGAETGRRLDYLLSDHLGSVVAVVEGTETSSGQTRWDVREERAFDPWGGCRDPDTWKACAKDSVLPKDDGACQCRLKFPQKCRSKNPHVGLTPETPGVGVNPAVGVGRPLVHFQGRGWFIEGGCAFLAKFPPVPPQSFHPFHAKVATGSGHSRQREVCNSSLTEMGNLKSPPTPSTTPLSGIWAHRSSGTGRTPSPRPPGHWPARFHAGPAWPSAEATSADSSARSSSCASSTAAACFPGRLPPARPRSPWRHRRWPVWGRSCRGTSASAAPHASSGSIPEPRPRSPESASRRAHSRR